MTPIFSAPAPRLNEGVAAAPAFGANQVGGGSVERPGAGENIDCIAIVWFLASFFIAHYRRNLFWALNSHYAFEPISPQQTIIQNER